MHIQTAKLLYFSPTGTTQKVLQRIARGLDLQAEEINITTPQARAQSLQTCNNELLIVGVPVYMGRVPALVSDWLRTITADNTPVVCVVVYGNREYDNALLELSDLLSSRGCVPIAGAAFIGEHSFSSAATPIAANRPDMDDLAQAELFGKSIRNKLATVSRPADFANLQLPGSQPYGGVTQLWDVDFIAISDACTQCGLCAQVCPVAAIAAEDLQTIDIVKCITCCACIKSCPQNARSIKSSPVYDASQRLNKLYDERKEPELFV